MLLIKQWHLWWPVWQQLWVGHQALDWKCYTLCWTPSCFARAKHQRWQMTCAIKSSLWFPALLQSGAFKTRCMAVFTWNSLFQNALAIPSLLEKYVKYKWWKKYSAHITFLGGKKNKHVNLPCPFVSAVRLLVLLAQLWCIIPAPCTACAESRRQPQREHCAWHGPSAKLLWASGRRWQNLFWLLFLCLKKMTN